MASTASIFEVCVEPIGKAVSDTKRVPDFGSKLKDNALDLV